MPRPVTDIAREVATIKEKIDSLRLAQAEARGRLNQLLSTLKDQFNCETITEADYYKEELEKEVQLFEQELTQRIKEIQEALNGQGN